MQPHQINLTNWQTTTKQKIAKRILCKTFDLMQHACLHLTDHEGNQQQFGDSQSDLHAEVVVLHPDFYARMLSQGSIGAAEAYIDGWWQTPNLTNVIRFFARHLPLLDSIERRVSWLNQAVRKMNHWRNRNTKRNAKTNITAHYDLGNALYQCFLDDNMLYSSGLYLKDQDSLANAQRQKMARLCQQLKLTPQDHLLEIGSGWGGMAIYAAKHYGCQVTTTTISEQQYQYAKARIADEQLEDKITLLKQDYRNLSGQFDKLVSIEMIEAVGKNYLPQFIKTCQARLKPNGLMALQAITIADQRFAHYSHGVDFIQKHIFPGGFLPSLSVLITAYRDYSDMVLRDVKDIGLDYARTLQDWQRAFHHNQDRLAALGYDEDFVRLWHYYFCYCQGGFEERSISAVQLLLSKAKY